MSATTVDVAHTWGRREQGAYPPGYAPCSFSMTALTNTTPPDRVPPRCQLQRYSTKRPQNVWYSHAVDEMLT